jgi:hypothetical protein
MAMVLSVKTDFEFTKSTAETQAPEFRATESRTAFITTLVDASRADAVRVSPSHGFRKRVYDEDTPRWWGINE